MAQKNVVASGVKNESQGSHDGAAWAECVQRMEVGVGVNPGIAIEWADDETLHACLGVEGVPGLAGGPVAPVAQGVDAGASGAAVRAWFSRVVTGVNAGAPMLVEEGMRSCMFFHRLKVRDLGAIAMALQERSINLVWGCALAAAELSAGRFYMVTANRRGERVLTVQQYVPFV